MCIFTHFAAGALAGGLTGNVYLGAAAGLASHAVLDVIPHYDHPDWRLELGGGVLSLLLLLLMPFASWPAVIGGIFGMVPDLENLFQKLGKMRRDQFIYPTHTGLLPHGRNLGPKSIIWQFAIFAVCFVLLGMFRPSTVTAAPGAAVPVMASPEVRVLASSAERTVVRVDFPVANHPDDWQIVDLDFVQWALPLYVQEPADTPDVATALPVLLPPRLGLSLAVPTRHAVTWRTRDVQWWKEPTNGQLTADLVHFSPPVVSRSVPLTGTELPLGIIGGVLRSVTIEVNHPATGAQRDHLQWAVEVANSATGATANWDRWHEEVPASVLNPELFEALAKGSRQGALLAKDKSADKAEVQDLFPLTNNWVKLYLTETGLYRLTGQELSNLGVSTTAIDPTKLRVYRGGGLPLAANPETPDADQVDRIGLNEVAIEVVDGGDGEWNLDDELRFYGVGTSAWLDRLGAAGEMLEHFDHNYADEAVYWLTWEDDLSATALPGAPKRTASIAAVATGGVQQASGRLRLHREEQALDSAGRVQDNWLWFNAIRSSWPETFSLRTPLAGSSARYQVDVRGIYPTSSNFVFEVSAYLNGDQANEATLTFNNTDQINSLRMLLIGESTDISPGSNLLTVNNNSSDRPLLFLAVDSFDILYWSKLELTPGFGQLDFAHWGDQVAAPGTGVDLIVNAPAGGLPLMWDVTDPANPQILVGAVAGGTNNTVYGVVRDPDSDRHFVTTAENDLLSVVHGARVLPVSLRSRSTDLDYIVVHATAFTSAALDLAAYHSDYLPGVVSPAAAAVSVDVIYDNFSGGQHDPRAIRNYLKWVYEQSAHRLGYACFLGNASRDYRNYGDRTPLTDLFDLVSTVLRSSFPSNPSSLSILLTYGSDDGLVSFDNVVAGDFDFPDLACGRLPALTVEEARAMVERAIAYSRDPVPGLWRNRVLMTADDVVRPSTYPNPQFGEDAHTRKAEDVSNEQLPLSLDVVKVYGVDYDFPPGSQVKPGMSTDIKNGLNEGTTIFYYVGHGAEDNLADEQVFRSADIPNLTNGMKRPVFMAFSCDVGVYESPVRRSMAEQFIQYDSGGAIGAICASQVSFIPYNNALTDAFFGHLYPERHIDADKPLAESLRLAKADMTQRWQFRTNSQRYNLFGDPGMRLPHPVDDLSFTAASLDTLRAGLRQEAVLSGTGKALLGAGDAYNLRVEESAWGRRYPFTSSLAETTFIKPGSPVFVGTGTMGSGDLVVPFKVPVQLRFGDLARVRLVVSAPDGDHIAVAQMPAVRSALGPSNDILGPAIALVPEDDSHPVRPGDPMVATLSDTSGIAILGTNPGNSLLLELDNTGFMTDVTEAFVYDPESYTSGRLVFRLPFDLAEGRHMAALHASDALGNVGSDTLSFGIDPEGIPSIRLMTLFPNPTAGECRLVFKLSEPMEMQWDIYTLAGNRLRSIRASLGAGSQVMLWDGLDSENDEIANGTYLYVLRGLGAFVAEREIRKTGKLVIMR